MVCNCYNREIFKFNPLSAIFRKFGFNTISDDWLNLNTKFVVKTLRRFDDFA